MNILAKSTITVFSLVLGGCAHHAGYYSGYSGSGAYGVNLNSYASYRPYPVYYNQYFDAYYNPHRHHKPYYDRYHYNYDKHYGHKPKHAKKFKPNYNVDGRLLQNRHSKETKYYAKRDSKDRHFSDSRHRNYNYDKHHGHKPKHAKKFKPNYNVDGRFLQNRHNKETKYYAEMNSKRKAPKGRHFSDSRHRNDRYSGKTSSRSSGSDNSRQRREKVSSLSRYHFSRNRYRTHTK